METVFNVLHVVAAVFIIGPMAILPMTAMRSVRAGQGGQVATLAKSTFVFTLLSLLVVILGFGVMGMADPKYHLSFTTPWILTSMILYLVALAVSLLLVVPALRAAAVRLQGANGAASEGKEYPRIAMGSGLVSLLLLVVVILMVWKP
jgi:uncharacterized membrane protein